MTIFLLRSKVLGHIATRGIAYSQ